MTTKCQAVYKDVEQQIEHYIDPLEFYGPRLPSHGPEYVRRFTTNCKAWLEGLGTQCYFYNGDTQTSCPNILDHVHTNWTDGLHIDLAKWEAGMHLHTTNLILSEKLPLRESYVRSGVFRTPLPPSPMYDPDFFTINDHWDLTSYCSKTLECYALVLIGIEMVKNLCPNDPYHTGITYSVDRLPNGMVTHLTWDGNQKRPHRSECWVDRLRKAHLQFAAKIPSILPAVLRQLNGREWKTIK
jgi:hypothetical protein